MKQDIQDRILDRVSLADSGCWIWTGYKNTAGYGRLYVDGKTRPAHRIAYELFRGPIAEGLVIDHLCGVPACINPDHLDATTQMVNTLRSFAGSALNARKTRCNAGHKLPPYEPRKRRKCAECHRARNREYYDRETAARGVVRRGWRRQIAKSLQISSQTTHV